MRSDGQHMPPKISWCPEEGISEDSRSGSCSATCRASSSTGTIGKEISHEGAEIESISEDSCKGSSESIGRSVS